MLHCACEMNLFSEQPITWIAQVEYPGQRTLRLTMADGTHGIARIANERKQRHGRLLIERLTILCYVDLLVLKMAEGSGSYRSDSGT